MFFIMLKRRDGQESVVKHYQKLKTKKGRLETVGLFYLFTLGEKIMDLCHFI
jgi:hypothetical protein